jgi:hypothetical protein
MHISNANFDTCFICLTSIDGIEYLSTISTFSRNVQHILKPSLQCLYHNSTRSLKKYFEASNGPKTSKRVKTFFPNYLTTWFYISLFLFNFCVLISILFNQSFPLYHFWVFHILYLLCFWNILATEMILLSRLY